MYVYCSLILSYIIQLISTIHFGGLIIFNDTFSIVRLGHVHRNSTQHNPTPSFGDPPIKIDG